MKKILIPFSCLLISGMSYGQASPSMTENYVYSKTYLSDPSASSPKTSETVQYFDGLGRVKQVVNVKASPLGKDLVTPITYDGFGRQADSFLPAPMATQNGGIQSGVEASAKNYHGDNFPFTHKNLENSPLDRVLSQVQPGSDWQNHPVSFRYDANAAGEVRKYTTVTTTVEGRTDSVLKVSDDGNSSGGFYKESQLYKNTVTDEDGNKTIEFKNGQGQLVLVRKVLSDTETADTYYIYNEYSQLAFVIPPKAAEAFKALGAGTSISSSDTTLTELCYQYRYDGRNRLVEKKVPGKGWEYLCYDQADRLILTQDAELRKKERWLITKYDPLGRVAYTGILAGGSRADMQSQTGSTIIKETRNDGNYFIRNGMQIYYTNSLFYQIETVLSVNYYDSYLPGDPFPAMVYDHVVLPSNVQQYGVSTKGLPVSSFVKNIEDDKWTKTYMYYDLKGRLIREYSQNHLGGYTNVEKRLYFSGVPNIILTQHKRLATDTERVITETFEYDSQNRLLVHKHKVDNNPEEILAQNTYNELSQLTNKKVGGISASNPLQSIDYAYNIRGWMTKVNDPDNLGSDLFGYAMKYNNPENTGLSTGRFNGNIAAIDWKTSTVANDNKRRYSFTYDRFNRLQQGIYSEPGSSVINNNNYNEQLTYDLNGNILTLKRFSKPYSGITPELIDDLVYNYTGNRLDKITLPSGTVNNASGYNALQNTITYNANGSMVNQLDKNINTIEYNHLNLPRLFSRGSSRLRQTITYTYRADGVKVGKNVAGGFLFSTTTDYLDGFQYQVSLVGDGQDSSNFLQFFPTSEGYFDFQQNKYIYNYTDHLGNVRLSYFNNGSSTEVIEENNYYPFGLKHGGYNELAGNPAYQYKYNGKELQTETGMYDYGARFYMPDIGRWGVVDPLAEKMRRHSPYNYAFNNPIRFIDPDGRQGTDWVGRTDATGSTKWHWEDKIKSASQAAAAGYDSYSDGVTNNTYKSISGSEVTLGTNGNWSEDFTDVNSARLGQAIANCQACQQIETFEKALFIGVPVVLATGGAGGFALSGEMSATAIGGRILTDMSVQTAANFSTNGGDFKRAVGDMNLTQTALAGVGMNYVGNSLISASTNVSIGNPTKSIFNGTLTGSEFTTQAALGIAGGGIVDKIGGSSVFRSTVVGAYMRTTSSFGPTAGTAVANVLMSTPDYGASVIQNNIP
ncbi:DUF6443 domain-containing protein [Chryseobacterium camelliae]|uniref:DUF6443 domain-containing protein n=1 Tax=Chryseobacterium camelliae TaxID=1265445 RepID=UPI002864F39C|nr:DUF6443 domain-containing protein [Chryseobacterium camelliae]MDR6516413.1 RHS repeat-associated protein [Chryseobacterium camelliae]